MEIICLSGLSIEITHKINLLKEQCEDFEKVALKLEIPYKLAAYGKINDQISFSFDEAITAWEEYRIKQNRSYSDFLCIEDDRIIGYIGICNFGNMPIEVNGMVAPAYRRKGIFSKLFSYVCIEWYQLENQGMLLLTNQELEAGQAFVKHQSGEYSHTEYEMILDLSKYQDIFKESISLRPATNQDVQEIAYQNSLYNFCDYDEALTLNPEVEAERGMFIYMAIYHHKIVGKVHTQVDNNSGGIFGLGVVPSYRKRGFGRIILQRAIDLLLEKNIKHIYLQVEASNQNALDLYTSSGFQIVSAMDYFLFNRPQNRHLSIKNKKFYHR